MLLDIPYASIQFSPIKMYVQSNFSIYGCFTLPEKKDSSKTMLCNNVDQNDSCSYIFLRTTDFYHSMCISVVWRDAMCTDCVRIDKLKRKKLMKNYSSSLFTAQDHWFMNDYCKFVPVSWSLLIACNDPRRNSSSFTNRHEKLSSNVQFYYFFHACKMREMGIYAVKFPNIYEANE